MKLKKCDPDRLPKRISSGRQVICVDKVDCCLNCIRRRRKPKRKSKQNRTRSFRERICE